MVAKLKSRYSVIFFLLVLIAGGFYYTTLNAESNKPEKCLNRAVMLTPPEDATGNQNKKQSVTIKAELALTEDQRKQGLMHRHHLDEKAGMMFFWEEPQQIFMWMKNTFIPLDMIFINGQKVVGIVEATQTQNTTPLTVPAFADKILEVNHGLTKAHGVKKGWSAQIGKCLP